MLGKPYGGTVWHTPAVDRTGSDLLDRSWPDYNGAIRPGDNLFTASIVAFDAYSGEYRWYFQQVHHDIWYLMRRILLSCSTWSMRAF